MDAYSFGMLALWLLFSKTQDAGKSDFLGETAESNAIHDLAKQLLMNFFGLDMKRKDLLTEFFGLSLALEVSQRTADMHAFLFLLIRCKENPVSQDLDYAKAFGSCFAPQREHTSPKFMEKFEGSHLSCFWVTEK